MDVCRQSPLMDAHISGWKLEEKYIYFLYILKALVYSQSIYLQIFVN